MGQASASANLSLRSMHEASNAPPKLASKTLNMNGRDVVKLLHPVACNPATWLALHFGRSCILLPPGTAYCLGQQPSKRGRCAPGDQHTHPIQAFTGDGTQYRFPSCTPRLPIVRRPDLFLQLVCKTVVRGRRILGRCYQCHCLDKQVCLCMHPMYKRIGYIRVVLACQTLLDPTCA